VIDLSVKVAREPDAVVTVEDVKLWEERNGPVPAGAFVALRTDWSKRMS
jgi:kynurenine formamidase